MAQRQRITLARFTPRVSISCSAAILVLGLATTGSGCSAPKIVEPGDWRLSFKVRRGDVQDPADKVVQLTLHFHKETKAVLVKVQYLAPQDEGESPDDAAPFELRGPLQETVRDTGEKSYALRLDGFDRDWSLSLMGTVTSTKSIRGTFRAHSRVNDKHAALGDWKLTRIDTTQ